MAKGKAAMTIGLETICLNPLATIIIMAAGEGKANVVRAAIEDSKDSTRPASVLHGHKGSRFYLTHGAAMALTARKAERLHDLSKDIVDWAKAHNALISASSFDADIEQIISPPPIDYARAEAFLVEVALRNKLRLLDVQMSHIQTHFSTLSFLPDWFVDSENLCTLKLCADLRIKQKIVCGHRLSKMMDRTILHTAPHHDDIMLSYHAAMHSILGRPDDGWKLENLGESQYGNKNFFVYLTSGFHSVNDRFLLNHIELARGSSDGGHFSSLKNLVYSGDLEKNYDILMKEFYCAFVDKDIDRQKYIESVIFARALKTVWNIDTSSNDETFNALVEIIVYIETKYLKEHKPGDSVPKEIQLLKGRMRESEVDRVWALSRMPMDRIFHLRSRFYTDDFFAPQPTLHGDAKPVADLIVKLQPQFISVAFDPEGTGPDTHYKVLQIVAAGLKMTRDNSQIKSDPIIWGYRNVWFMFTPSDATIMIPGSESDLNLMHDTFMSCFTTQKNASFPSPSYEGPFSAWANSIQREQRKNLGILIGEDWFQNHDVDAIRNSAGFVYLKAMMSSVFLSEVDDLRVKLVGNI